MRFKLLLQLTFVIWLLFPATFTPRLYAEIPLDLVLFTDRPLSEVLDEMSEKYQVFFAFDAELVEGISVSFAVNTEEKLEVAINRLLVATDLRYKYLGSKYYVIYKNDKTGNRTARKLERKINQIQDLEKTGKLSLQPAAGEQSKRLTSISRAVAVMKIVEKTITGSVANEAGEPLAGATVLAKGTRQGVLTDNMGRYSITVPDNVTALVISYIGYAPQEVEIENRTVINVVMADNVSLLDEVVVVGYGTQERKDLTGSVASVNSRDITALPTTNAATALQGRAAGVAVTENSGRPGAPSRVSIRGVGTVGNSDPLYVVDGQITSDINQINPNDIASMDVLKDAAAGAIYGARAANGVVLITTKRGQAGATRISFNSYYGTQQIDPNRVRFVNAEEYVRMHNEGREFNGLPLLFTESPESFRGRSTNFWELAFQDGFITDNNISISGGNETSTYLLSVGYLQNEGVVIGQNYERYTMRLNTDHKLAKWLKIGESLQVSRANSVGIGGNGSFGSVMNGAKTMAPTIFPEILPDGSWNGPTRPGEPAGFATFNPRQVVAEQENLNKTWQMLGNVYGEIEFFEGLTFRTTFHGNFLFNDGTNWAPQLVAGLSVGNPTILSRNNSTRFNWQIDNVLSYSNTFGKHSISALAGFLAQEDVFESLSVSIQGFPDEGVNVINGGTPSTLLGNGGKEDWAINSYIGRINYSYDGKYLLQANVRRDGSSRFGPENRWGVFPSFSAGWRVSQEDFFNVSFIDELKFRGSWGQLGNDQIGLYAFASAINLSQNYTLGASQAILPGAAPIALANPDIKWEQTTQLNFGVDLGMLNNRLFVNIDWFQKDTDDMLLRVPVPASSGYTTAPFVNAGAVRNSGLELMATYRKATGAFTWDLGMNFSTVNNEVLALGNGEAVILGNPANGGYQIADVGTPIYAFYGYRATGLYQTQAEVEADNALSSERTEYDPGAGPGSIRFEDIDGDGLITAEDRTIIGSPYPDFTYGINFRAEYKGFDLTIFLQGISGNEIMISPNDNFENQPGGRLQYNTRRWKQAGDTNDPVLWGWQGLKNASGGRDGRISDAQVFDGSYLRGKNVMLGYSFPSSVTDKIGFSRIRVYLSTKNLFTIWNRPEYNNFFDPELGLDGGAGNDGEAGGFGKYNLNAVPQPTTILGGINLDL